MTNLIYLNNAATSYPKPINVINTVKNYIDSVPLNITRSGLEFSQNNVVKQCRKNLAFLLNIDNPNNIIFTSGATESLNLAILGIEPENSHIITSITEHNSVIRPLKHLERTGEISVSFIKCDKKGLVDPVDIKNKIKKNTKAIIINHCSNVTGQIQNIFKIGEIAKENNIYFIVDGSQSIGNINIDLKKTYIDVFAFTGHKSLFGLQGIGGIYINDKLKLKPLKTGGTGIKSQLTFQPEEIPLFYEAGTQNIAGITSLNAGCKYILDTTILKIQQKKLKLLNKIYDQLSSMPQIDIYGYCSENNIGILSFNVKNIDNSEIGYILQNSFNIVVRTGLHCAPLIHEALGTNPKGTIRLSPSCFTLKEDVDIFLEAIIKICR